MLKRGGKRQDARAMEETARPEHELPMTKDLTMDHVELVAEAFPDSATAAHYAFLKSMDVEHYDEQVGFLHNILLNKKTSPASQGLLAKILPSYFKDPGVDSRDSPLALPKEIGDKLTLKQIQASVGTFSHYKNIAYGTNYMARSLLSVKGRLQLSPSEVDSLQAVQRQSSSIVKDITAAIEAFEQAVSQKILSHGDVGKTAGLERELVEKDKVYDTALRQITTLHDEASEMKKKLEGQSRDARNASEKIVQLQEELDEQEEAVETKSKQFRKRDNLLREAREAVREKDEELASLRAEIEDLTTARKGKEPTSPSVPSPPSSPTSDVVNTGSVIDEFYHENGKKVRRMAKFFDIIYTGISQEAVKGDIGVLSGDIGYTGAGPRDKPGKGLFAVQLQEGYDHDGDDDDEHQNELKVYNEFVDKISEDGLGYDEQGEGFNYRVIAPDIRPYVLVNQVPSNKAGRRLWGITIRPLYGFTPIAARIQIHFSRGNKSRDDEAYLDSVVYLNHSRDPDDEEASDYSEDEESGWWPYPKDGEKKPGHSVNIVLMDEEGFKSQRTKSGQVANRWDGDIKRYLEAAFEADLKTYDEEQDYDFTAPSPKYEHYPVAIGRGSGVSHSFRPPSTKTNYAPFKYIFDDTPNGQNVKKVRIICDVLLLSASKAEFSGPGAKQLYRKVSDEFLKIPIEKHVDTRLGDSFDGDDYIDKIQGLTKVIESLPGLSKTLPGVTFDEDTKGPAMFYMKYDQTFDKDEFDKLSHVLPNQTASIPLDKEEKIKDIKGFGKILNAGEKMDDDDDEGWS